jgi:hypothetical protein
MRDIPRQRWLGLAAAAAVIGVASSSAIAGSPSASVAALEQRFGNPLAAAERLGIMSTLDNKNVLSHRIRWIAYPKPLREVGKVDFLIDGKVRWIEKNTPYVYGDDSNWLVTSWLSPGRHRFTVRAVTAGGRSVSKTTVARVLPAPAAPSQLSRTRWMREVTQAQAGKTTPGGRWVLEIDRTGWRIKDPHGGANWIDVLYLAPGRVRLRNGIWTRPRNAQEPNVQEGSGWCEDTNASGNYRWSLAAERLTIVLDGRDRCGTAGDERFRIVAGEWMRLR